jgi:hypothetical protein
MDATIFRAALRASAKVALGATISSCGGSIHATAAGDAVPDASTDAGAGDEPVLTDARIEGAAVVQDAEGVGTCNPPVASSLIPEQDHPGVRIDDGLFDCCASTIGSDFFLDGGPQVTLDAAAADPRIMGCCAVVVYRLNADLGDGAAISVDDGTLQEAGLTGVWSDVITTCCIPLHDYFGVCTPWGPPMPPAMPEVA